MRALTVSVKNLFRIDEIIAKLRQKIEAKHNGCRSTETVSFHL